MTSTAGTTVQQLSYPHHDANGNVTERYDGVAGTTETFHNDFLNRLDNWSHVSSSGMTSSVFTYDDLGNLSTRTTTGPSGTTMLTYGSGTRDAGVTAGEAGVHAVTSVGSDSYLYDAKGNQYSGPDRTVTYTSFNLPKSVTPQAGGAHPTSFRYDAGHGRAFKTGRSPRSLRGASTVYAGGLYEKRTDTLGNTTHVFYVPGADRIVAQVEWSSTNDPNGYITDKKVVYLHDDHLGSVESISGVKTPTQHLKYDPFGQRIDPQTLAPAQPPSDVTAGFTDQEHDDDLGLINMRGRMYDPKVARFLSADPLVSDPMSSGGFNRYSYVSNNPLNLIDPTGFVGEPRTCPAPGEPNQGPTSDKCPGVTKETPPITTGTTERDGTSVKTTGGRTCDSNGCGPVVKVYFDPASTVGGPGAHPTVPGPWNPPGRQPIPLYIGNAIHVAIPDYYQTVHPNDLVMSNNFPIASILGRLGVPVSPDLNPSLRLKPDIANLSLRVLYEIKPFNDLDGAQRKIVEDLATFAAFGMPFAPGLSSDPGAFGLISAPGGWASFFSPAPGIILYSYRSLSSPITATESSTAAVAIGAAALAALVVWSLPAYGGTPTDAPSRGSGISPVPLTNY